MLEGRRKGREKGETGRETIDGEKFIILNKFIMDFGFY